MTGQQRMGLFGVPGAVIVIVAMLVVPLPTYVLDLLITINMSAALVVLLTTMHVKKARDFSAFPSLLLIATMFRLAINVSVTRLVLLHADAGTVVHSFGSFVVGGQIVVGIVVFLILIIIQFVVVTSGAGRVSEVAARFSLDAMAPKLVAIDGELNTGLIDEKEARRRRKEIDETSEFYGNMDGASKFVRGDAVAALVITFINLVGGFAIGVIQMHLSVSDAIHTYSILSIGDGLVSQIPALLLSISAGIIVTRGATEDEDFGTDVVRQITRQPRALQIAGVAMAVLGLVPGLPHIPFLVVGAILYLASGRIRGSAASAVEDQAGEQPTGLAAPDTPQALAGEMRLERLELELAPESHFPGGPRARWRSPRPGARVAAEDRVREGIRNSHGTNQGQPQSLVQHLCGEGQRGGGSKGPRPARAHVGHRQWARGAAGRPDDRAGLRSTGEVDSGRGARASDPSWDHTH